MILAQTSNLLTTFFLPLILMVVVFYFLILRPQQKRNKERNRMLANIKQGDKIVTIGGLHGTIEELTETIVVLRVNESSKLTFDRSSVHSVVKDEKTK